jgi:hypothetical protein
MSKKLTVSAEGGVLVSRIYEPADLGITAHDLAGAAGVTTGLTVDCGAFTQFQLIVVPTGAGVATSTGVTARITCFSYDGALTFFDADCTTGGIVLATAPWTFSWGFGTAGGSSGTTTTGFSALRSASRLRVKLTNSGTAGSGTLTGSVYLIGSM